MSQRFAHLSDPHLSSLDGVRPRSLLNKRLLGYLSWRRRRRHEHRIEVLDALLEDLDGQTVSQILVTGDLTHVGLPAEFSQARDWLKRLGEPNAVALVPGNHDACVHTAWRETFALWESYMASDPPGRAGAIFPSLRIRGSIAFVGLSTACPTPPLMASGRLDAAQLDALPRLLDEAEQRGLFRVVYLHHSPVPGGERWRKRLENAAALADIIERHGAELILHGHGHRARRGALRGRHGDVPVIAVPSASALGLHGADVAAYNRYRLDRCDDGWQLAVEARYYDPARGRFESGATTALSIPRAATPHP